MGTISIDDYEYGTKCAAVGGTTSVIDFIIPGARQLSPSVTDKPQRTHPHPHLSR
jgi:hypothetical protein